VEQRQDFIFAFNLDSGNVRKEYILQNKHFCM